MSLLTENHAFNFLPKDKIVFHHINGRNDNNKKFLMSLLTENHAFNFLPKDKIVFHHINGRNNL